MIYPREVRWLLRSVRKCAVLMLSVEDGGEGWE